MKKISLLILLISTLYSGAMAQNLTDLFTNVDTLFLAGTSPGHLSIIDGDAKPIVSSSPCNSPRYNYSVAREYKRGKVIAIGHEGLLANNNIEFYDNLTFLINTMNWLNAGSRTKRVKLKENWVNNGNTGTFQKALMENNYVFTAFSEKITRASIANTDILILGNDWNDRAAYSRSELATIEAFVANGGSLFIAGLGWSWPKELDLYPMNAVAKMFGFEYTKASIHDEAANIDGSPKLYNFYPENLNTTDPYCPFPFLGINIGRGKNLRVLRLAVSTNGEFTKQSGGVAATARILDKWLEQINEMYGREYAVRFELIPNNNQLLFSNPNRDPWETLPPGSGGCTNADIILSQQERVIDEIIGAENYDISHVIVGEPFGGGCAGGFKSGVSGGVDLSVTRHEMGHQFSQSHTINHSDKRNYEPENGSWSVQGGNSQGHAHAVSYHQLANFLLKNVPNAGKKIPTGNTIPSVYAGADVVIPISTPFTLTATASDPDAGDNLTYVWDNMNPGMPQKIPVKDDSQGAIFMRLLPSPNPSRTFPRMSDVVANKNVNEQEQLPSQPRIMDIRLTVNDNHKMRYKGEWVNASGTKSSDVKITVADAGSFVVTSQGTSGIVYTGGSSQKVTWQVNGTNKAPVNTKNVKISLSTDGGYTYPMVLSESTPNEGSAMVRLPNISTSSARIKVEAVNNIYFDINTQDFEIVKGLKEKVKDKDKAEKKPTAFSVDISPSSVTDYFKIQLPTQIRFLVKIYDAKGTLLAAELNKNYFDVSGFSKGWYSLEITDIDTYKVVTKRIRID